MQKASISSALQQKWFETLTTLIGALGTASSYFQAYTILKLQSVYAVSLPGYIASCVASLFLFVYGCSRHILPLIICNSLSLIGALFVIALILIY